MLYKIYKMLIILNKSFKKSGAILFIQGWHNFIVTLLTYQVHPENIKE
jgi:hypothetical protein